MIEIREMRFEDLDAVASLLGQLKDVTALHGSVEPVSLRSTFAEMLRLPEVYRNYLAVEDDRVVGLVSLVLYKTLLHPGGTGLINELVVSEKSRRRGIGKDLLEAAIRVAREQGMEEIEVGTETGNRIARRFYAGAGFDREYVLYGKEF